MNEHYKNYERTLKEIIYSDSATFLQCLPGIQKLISKMEFQIVGRRVNNITDFKKCVSTLTFKGIEAISQFNASKKQIFGKCEKDIREYCENQIYECMKQLSTTELLLFIE